LATGYSKLSFFHHLTVCKVSVGNFTWIWNILIHGAVIGVLPRVEEFASQITSSVSYSD
jgi:hypothetical protein